MSKFRFRTLRPADIDQMYQSFMEAFSQYSIDMKMPQDLFELRMVERLNISWDASPAVFVGDKLVGFIFHAVGEYNGETVAYNGGTGVIPGYWGNGITGQMYEFITPELKKMAISKAVLEVISTNEKGIKAYSKIGFQNSKYVKCFKLEKEIPPRRIPSDIHIQATEHPDLSAYAKLGESIKCYGDQMNQMPFAIKSETALEARNDNELVGFLIFQRRTGRVSHLIVAEKHRKQGIGSALLRQAQELSSDKTLLAINIEESQIGPIHFFETNGFENKLDQWEMTLEL